MGNEILSGDIPTEEVADVGTTGFGGKVNVERIDTQALQELIDSHGAALKLYARQWCNSPDDALQEALIELLRQKPVPDHPAAWLFTTIRRRAMNLTRGETRRSVHHHRANEQRDQWFADDESPGFDSQELARMLDQLPALEREILVARIWGELPFERIAELVNLSSSSVHRRYGRALSLLRQMIDEEEDKSGRKDESKAPISR